MLQLTKFEEEFNGRQMKFEDSCSLFFEKMSSSELQFQAQAEKFKLLQDKVNIFC